MLERNTITRLPPVSTFSEGNGREGNGPSNASDTESRNKGRLVKGPGGNILGVM